MTAVRRDRRFLALAAALAVSLALSSCSPGASHKAKGPSGAVSTEIPDSKVTLNLASYEVGGQADAIKNVIAAYQKLHSNVTIKTQFTNFADYGKNIKLRMSSDSAPDIAEIGQAWVMEGPVVQAGLLLPLDKYAAAYHWDDRFKPGLLDESRFSTDGKSFGTGNLYGLAFGGNMVGVYYNKAKLAKLGITAMPTTLAEFTAALAKAKAAHELPIELGNLEQWPGNHLLSDLISQYASSEEMTKWIYGRKGSTFDTPAVRQAATTLSVWAKNGYIDANANGIANEDGVKKFIKGNGVFLIGGSWSQAEIDGGMKGGAGLMAMPPAQAGGPVRATGATTAPYGISPRSKNAAVAANFLDFATSPGQAATLFAGGYLPVSAGNNLQPKTGTAQEGTVSVYRQLLAGDGLTLFLDWSTPSMGDTLFPAVSELMGGKISVDKLISKVQANWSDFNKSS